jgi:hypothetical protein
MQRHLSYSFFSLTTDLNRASQNPRVPALQEGKELGVRVHDFFTSGCLLILFRLQSMATLKEGDKWQMWEFIRVLVV